MKASGSARHVNITYSNAGNNETSTNYTVLLEKQKNILVAVKHKVTNKQSAAQAGATNSHLLHALPGAARTAANVHQNNLNHQKWQCTKATMSAPKPNTQRKPMTRLHKQLITTSVDQKAYGAKVTTQRTQTYQ